MNTERNVMTTYSRMTKTLDTVLDIPLAGQSKYSTITVLVHYLGDDDQIIPVCLAAPITVLHELSADSFIQLQVKDSISRRPTDLIIGVATYILTDESIVYYQLACDFNAIPAVKEHNNTITSGVAA